MSIFPQWTPGEIAQAQEALRLTNDPRKELAYEDDPRWDRVDDLLAELGYWSGR